MKGNISTISYLQHMPLTKPVCVDLSSFDTTWLRKRSVEVAVIISILENNCLISGHNM